MTLNVDNCQDTVHELYNFCVREDHCVNIPPLCIHCETIRMLIEEEDPELILFYTSSYGD